ncbi:MAG: NAD(+) synthase [Acidobacteria bacterium]|uniref:NH(3)-dependent NAD(+) synthetase n=1 Tax=Candidatus Polarisedimenticola svalbardensis TaxID=2886004 RepID=A0A8J6Y4P6_9BACT|nr:NAD(+) synthase [Candidatus Polarisedimenticola svalbardensis]
MNFNLDVLKIDPAQELESLSRFVVDQVSTVFRRNGVIVGLSGGIDSACMAAVAVRALGKEKVIGLVLPESESNPISSAYAIKHAQALGVEHREIEITPTVDSVVEYQWRDEYLRKLIPEYKPDYKYNITLPTDLLERASFNFYRLQVQMPDGEIKSKRLNPDEFRTITSFANIKIRARMLHLYAEAERRGLLVAGTTNRTEFILGDFCKYGDGGTDIEPFTHLYKNQIYQLSDHLEVIPEIMNRQPSPDTFSLPVSDQEFFFRIPFEKLDHLLYAWEHELPKDAVAEVLDLSEDAVERAYKDFASKYRATAHLREGPTTFK